MEHLFWYTSMDWNDPTLKARFFRTKAGNEPVREWLTSLQRADKHLIGSEIKTIQMGWPLGMPMSESWTKAYGRQGSTW